ncbi:hypothetical protein DIE08_29840 [Burkholderia sp. Bp9004]|nr:hypothetical protein DIE08_29840 [Burkholderia sp. Bp9004]
MTQPIVEIGRYFVFAHICPDLFPHYFPIALDRPEDDVSSVTIENDVRVAAGLAVFKTLPAIRIIIFN